VLQALFYPFFWTQQPLRTSPQAFRELSMPALELICCCWRSRASPCCTPTCLAPDLRLGRRTLHRAAHNRHLLDLGGHLRYLPLPGPLEMLSFVILGLCVRRLFSPLRPWPIAACLLAAIVIASLVTEQTDNIGRTAWAGRDITC